MGWGKEGRRSKRESEGMQEEDRRNRGGKEGVRKEDRGEVQKRKRERRRWCKGEEGAGREWGQVRRRKETLRSFNN